VTPPETPHVRLTAIRRLDIFLEKFLRGLLPEERRYLFLVPWVGIASGLVAVVLVKILGFVQSLSWVVPAGLQWGAGLLDSAEKLAGERPWLVILIPTGGGAIVALSLFFIRERGRLGGTPALMEALAFKKGRIPFLRTLAEGLVSITAVGAGASLGREGAMVHSGAAFGSWLATRFHLADHHVKILLACGAAGGMAAAYDAPIGATVFAMEILLGSFAIELFGPIIICSVLSTAVSHLIFGEGAVYTIKEYVVGGYWEIALHLILGVLLGLVSVIFIRLFSGIYTLFGWLRPVAGFRPIVAMAILGFVGIFFPRLFGNGYDTVNEVLIGEGDQAIHLLILLPALKMLMTALCRAGGISGGLFTPSLFMGALLGAAFATAMAGLFPLLHLSPPQVYSLVGMGAIVSGTLQAPITAILLVFELTRDYGLILPLMSACIASAVVSHLLQAGSLYTEPLRREGIFFPSASTPLWIRQPEVRTVITEEVATVRPAARFREITDQFLRAPEGQEHLYVTDSSGRCLGVISLHDIKRFIKEVENLDSVIAADLLSPSFSFVYGSDPVSRAIEILAGFSFERLPVLDGPETMRLLGTVSKRKLLLAYRESNLARKEVDLREGELER
jgi:CIC family chloride channel protein